MRTESVGKAHPHVRAKIVDEDGTYRTHRNPRRNLCFWISPTEGVRLIGMMNLLETLMVVRRYWKDAEKSFAVMRRHRNSDGGESIWMHTGDIGVLDEQGYLKVSWTPNLS